VSTYFSRDLNGLFGLQGRVWASVSGRPTVEGRGGGRGTGINPPNPGSRRARRPAGT